MKPTFVLMNNSLPFVFSVPPMDLRIEDKQQVVSVRLINFGETMKMRERDCTRISFSSFFPNLLSHFYKPFLNPLTPILCVDELKEWKNAKTKLRLMVPEFNVSYYCYIESFTHIYDERTGDIHFELSLIEHRDPKKIDTVSGLFERWS